MVVSDMKQFCLRLLFYL